MISAERLAEIAALAVIASEPYSAAIRESVAEVRRLQEHVAEIAAETRENIAQDFDRLAGNCNPRDLEGSRRQSDFKRPCRCSCPTP